MTTAPFRPCAPLPIRSRCHISPLLGCSIDDLSLGQFCSLL
uniref:Uncharacterized protein n=1 Tax=Arundo donax TaxID=35708 RepID=A0A0A8YCN8_ARUDO